MTTAPKKPMTSVTLVNSETGVIWQKVTASYNPRDGLEIARQDLGEGASLLDDEYECWYKVKPKKLDDFCALLGIDPSDPLAGLKAKYSGRRRFLGLERLIGDAPMVEFSSYW